MPKSRQRQRKSSRSQNRGSGRPTPRNPVAPYRKVIELVDTADEALKAYIATRDTDALDFALDMAQEALLLHDVQLSVPPRSRASITSILGICTFYRYLARRRPNDLAESVKHLESFRAERNEPVAPGLFVDIVYVWALALIYEGDPSATNLAALQEVAWTVTAPDHYFGEVGMSWAGESGASIVLLKAELQSPSPAGPPRLELLLALARTYRSRAATTGIHADLDAAIRVTEGFRALKDEGMLYPWAEMERAACLAIRYENSGDLTDLNLAIEACERAVQTTLDGGHDPVESDLAYQWFELGLCRRMRGERTKSRSDFEEAYQAYLAGFAIVGRDDPIGCNGYYSLLRTEWGREVLADETVDLAAVLGESWENDPSESGVIHRLNLASQRVHRLLHEEQVSDARSALADFESLVEDIGHLRSRQLDALTQLSLMYVDLYGLSGNDGDRSYALELTGRVLARADERTPHDVANLWRTDGYLRSSGGDIEGAKPSYEASLKYMQQSIREATSRADQEHRLTGLSGLVSDVVVANCLTGDAETATQVGWESMGMLYREATRRRALVRMVTEADAAKGEELRSLYRAAGAQWAQFDAGHGLAIGAPLGNARHANAERIHALTEPFLPQLEATDQEKTDEPSAQDGLGTDVVEVAVFVSHMGIEAFVYLEDLLWCTFEVTQHDLHELRDVYAAVMDGDVDETEADSALGEISEWLGQNIFQPLVDWIYEHCEAERVHVRFCLSGRIGGFPIAAAWVKMPGTETRVRLSDALRFSLIPSLSAHLPHRSPLTRRSLEPYLVAAASDVPGRRLLKETRAEARFVAEALCSDRHEGRVLGLDAKTPATCSAVVDALADTHLLHFTGHAEIDFVHPDLSYLVLQDSAETRLTAGVIAELDLAEGRLAFLSACAVGQSRGRLRDDPFDLASAFVYAGYDYVIAPLRPIPDVRAREASELFYAALLEEAPGPDDCVDVRVAFGAMIRGLRAAHPDDTMAWAGFALLESPA